MYVIDPLKKSDCFSPGIDNMEELPYELEKFEETGRKPNNFL